MPQPPLSRHLDRYEQHLRAKGGDPRRISMLRRRIERLARECHFSRLNKMSAGSIERWLVEQADAGMAAATRNSYREAIVCFGNWCRRTHRLTQNPFDGLPRADQTADRRHRRRALTAAELMRLLKVARLRPPGGIRAGDFVEEARCPYNAVRSSTSRRRRKHPDKGRSQATAS